MPSLALIGAGGVAIGLLLVVSAFFSSSETAIFSLSREWIDSQSGSSDIRGRALTELHDDPHRLLVTLLVGNNVVNIAISSLMTVIVAGYLSPGPAVVTTTLATSFLVLVFGEIVPKAYGLGNAKRWSLTVATPIRTVERVLSPLITLFDVITRYLSARIPIESNIEAPYLDR
jgi:Mg2+/Co2+ transporter CorB